MNSSNIISIKELLERKKMDYTIFQKMFFIYNALEDGWTVKKKDSSYVFCKNIKNEQRKQVVEEAYLMNFIKSNIELNKILS